ncbi:hypothetical protein ACSW9P_15540 [Clostridium perfringens]
MAKLYKLNTFEHNEDMLIEGASINRTNKIIKDVKNGEYELKQIEKLLVSLNNKNNECYFRGKEFTSTDFNNTFKKWEDSANISKRKRLMDENYLDFCDLINDMKGHDDFICSYLIDDEIKEVWLVIKKATFRENKKYLKLVREFKLLKKVEFEFLILSENKIETINEKLKYVKAWDVVNA